jgi:uncharacterized protein
MNADTTRPSAPTCTAFLGTERIAFGPYGQVAATLNGLDLTHGGLLVFDDASGQLVDFPWPAGFEPAPAAQAAVVPEEEAPAAPSGVGRPRLGVVAREVTLLPRHWEWLAQQRGGASAALRRLVDEARKTYAEQDAQRQAKERVYRFMSAIGGGLPGFEEASRALFAHDSGAFAERIGHWPIDVKTHLAWLSRDAFADKAAAQNV